MLKRDIDIMHNHSFPSLFEFNRFETLQQHHKPLNSHVSTDFALIHDIKLIKVPIAGIIRLLFLIEHLDLMGVYFGEDQRTTNIVKTHVQKR